MTDVSLSDPSKINTPIKTENDASDLDLDGRVINTTDNMTTERTKALIRRTRCIKLCNTFLFIVGTILIITLASEDNLNGYQLCAYSLSLLYIIGGIYFILILFTSNNLHYIYVKRKSIDGYQNFITPNCTIEYHNRSIKSISALTGTFGSNAHGLFTRFAYATAGAVYACIVTKWNDRGNEQKIASILMLCGVFGNGIFGTWELEGPKNYLSSTMHYSCAPLIFVLQTVAYGVQQEFNNLSIVMLVSGCVVDIVYVIIIYTLPETSQDVNKVHRISLICILCELIALTIPSICVCFFVYSL